MRQIKIIVFVLILNVATSCEDHTEEVDNAITDLELIYEQLDEIGERNIAGYKQSFGLDEHNDTIQISEKEFRDIQLDLLRVIDDLEDLYGEMIRAYETD